MVTILRYHEGIRQASSLLKLKQKRSTGGDDREE